VTGAGTWCSSGPTRSCAGTGRGGAHAGLETGLKESLNRAWTYLQAAKERMGLAPALAQKDVVAEAIDISGGRAECACGVAFLAAMLSAATDRRVQAATVVLGDLSIQGNVNTLPSITEVLQLAQDNGALRILLPTGNRAQFSSLPEDVIEKLDLIFYSDIDRAMARIVEL
jgi:ATP-dependent Lon protease